MLLYRDLFFVSSYTDTKRSLVMKDMTIQMHIYICVWLILSRYASFMCFPLIWSTPSLWNRCLHTQQCPWRLYRWCKLFCQKHVNHEPKFCNSQSHVFHTHLLTSWTESTNFIAQKLKNIQQFLLKHLKHNSVGVFLFVISSMIT